MTIGIVIPVHNEEEFIRKTLDSLLSQSHLPDKIVIVDDHSTDRSAEIIREVEAKSERVKYIYHTSKPEHSPGGKVVEAFLAGMKSLNDRYDIICKFDGDLVFPGNYLESLVDHYKKNPSLGMVGGICYVEKNGTWVREKITGKDHIRGALKSYRWKCYKDIGGLNPAFGWDTIDELLAEYHGWCYNVDETLIVKHLKPTATRYVPSSGIDQGRAFYTMRLGSLLALIRGLVQTFRKRQPSWFRLILKGYLIAKRENTPFMVTSEEGRFIRRRQWRSIRKSILRL